MTTDARMDDMVEATTGLPVPTVVTDRLTVTFRVPVSSSGSGKRESRTQDVEAVKPTSLVIRRGEAVGIIGRNGSGKSTLLRAMAGLAPISSGEVWSASQPTLLGVNAALIPDLSGERNIVLGCLALGMTRREISERKAEVMEFAGLGDAIRRPMRTYSSGMGARLRFAIATAKVPDILLIDEALNTGDKEFRERSEDRIRSMRSQAGTVILVSHSLSVIKQTCTRALWLDKGKFRMDGTADEVVSAYDAYHEAWTEYSLRGAKRPRKPGPILGLDEQLRPIVSDEGDGDGL